jgi:hypothetical protein
MIIQQNPAVEKLCEPYRACIAIDFRDFNPSEVIRLLNKQSFYPIKPGNEVLWASEEEKWLRLIAHLMN